VLDPLIKNGTVPPLSVFTPDFAKKYGGANGKVLMMPGPSWYALSLFQQTLHIPAGQLDTVVWEDLCLVLSHPDQIAAALQQAQAGHWLPADLQARRARVQTARAQNERYQQRLLDAYLQGVLDLEEFTRKRQDLERQAEVLRTQQQHLDATARHQIELASVAASIESFCRQVRVGLERATFEQKRALVELLIDRVSVTDEEVEIRYVVPTSPEGPYRPFCQLRTDYLLLKPEAEIEVLSPRQVILYT